MSRARPIRVAEQIQRYLSSRLIPELRDPRLGFATVTGVEVTPDLKSARVYVTIYDPDGSKRAEAVAALNGAAGRFRHELGRGLALRYAPALHFVEDLSIERGDRIERLIDEIHRGEAPRGESGNGLGSGEDRRGGVREEDGDESGPSGPLPADPNVDHYRESTPAAEGKGAAESEGRGEPRVEEDEEE